MGKQSTQDRELRLSEGRCPVHGGWMSQIEPWHESDGVSYTVVGCSRRDCEIRAKAFSIDGPWELMPEYVYLLKQGEDGFAKIYEFTT